MNKIILAFMLLFGTVPDRNILVLATAIQGERPQLVCPNLDEQECQDLAMRVGQVAVNRLRAGWCDDMNECVNGGFWGAKHVVGVPEPWALVAAKRALRAPATEDLFVYSLQDCESLGLSLEDANHSARNGDWGLYFY